MVSTEIRENFKLLVMEVILQVENTRTLIHDKKTDLYRKINSRDDYIDNLKSLIEDKCFARLQATADLPRDETNYLRSMITIGNNLERIADFCENISKQLLYLSDLSFIEDYQTENYFDEILTALATIEKAIGESNADAAFRICRSEFELDRLFSDSMQRILEELRSSKETENLITTLFILRYLERIGDALLNIGESAVFAIVGEKLKIHQYEAIEESLQIANHSEWGDLSIHLFSETRSGCKIGKIKRKTEGGTGVLFKEGKISKLQEEHEKLTLWQHRFPGVAPRIFAFHASGDSGSLLVEFLNGRTFQDLVLSGDEEIYQSAFNLLTGQVGQIWRESLVYEEVPTDYMRQLAARLESVYHIHPDFRATRNTIGGLEFAAVDELLVAALKIETELASPLTVLTHGDFNTDNVLIDLTSSSVHYIDLHRSKQGDYVQDVATFLVSNFRIPLFDSLHRSCLERASIDFLHFALDFAIEHNDHTFQERLALALARSFLSSTRFITRQSFARVLFQRSYYLLEKVVTQKRYSKRNIVLSEDLFIYQ